MAMTSSQIVTMACQIAKSPGFTSQGGQWLNAVLQELAETFDFDLARGLYNFDFNTSLGSGPMPLPSDYLRAELDDVFYTIQGVKYVMINIDLAEFDALVQTAGINNYPTYYATDMSTSPPSMYVWMPPSGAYPVTIRYRRQMPDITTPETSSTVPWFPMQSYLVTRIAAEMMKITGDERWVQFIENAAAMLRQYLQMSDDRNSRAQTVKLDRRRFGRPFQTLPNTKIIGW